MLQSPSLPFADVGRNRHRDSHSNFSIALYYNIIEHSLNEAPEAGTDVMIFA